MKIKIKHRKMSSRENPELDALSKLVGQFIEYWGFKSVQGRIWLYLFASAEPLSSVDLSDLLGISPSLVTQSVQILLKFKVIQKAPKGMNGVLRYEANPNPQEAIRLVLEKRELPLLLKTGDTSKKALLASKKKRENVFRTNSNRINQVQGWCDLFGSLLSNGILLLSQPENPFSTPESFSDQKNDQFTGK